MTPRIATGDRLPQAVLGRLMNGRVQAVDLSSLIAGQRAIIVGIPGAFTPVCTCEHIPDLLANVARFRSNGVGHVICVAPDNPWVVDAWARDVDPDGRIMFLSDGNLAFARALGAAIVDHDRFLGEVSTRYMLLTHNGIVHRFSVEQHAMKLSCTRSQDVVFID